MHIVKALGAIALAAAATSSYAVDTVVFSDNFNTSAFGRNVTPTGWTVSSGSVDTLNTSYYGNFCTLAGLAGGCIDLDGTTHAAGTLMKVDLGPIVAGATYTATFKLAGSWRPGYDSGNTVEVAFSDGGSGSASGTYNLATFDTASTKSLSFVATASGFATLSFHNLGGDNVGALLDDVLVTTPAVPVPEPESIAMMLAGLGLIGFLQRRRRGT